MEYRFKITQQPASRLEEFPFSEIVPNSSQCFFVPDAKAGLRGSQIRYYAKKSGVKVKLRRRFFDDEWGFFVWIKSAKLPQITAYSVPMPDAVTAKTI
tara:strand:- start:791 stop:1084 length:294 start_codon:yes stop_codon:yes gene_type:complete